MAKAPKSGGGRKPPEPTDSHEEIADWMKRVMPDLQPVVRKLDELIREAHPDATFALKWKKAHYGLPDYGWIIELVAYDVSVNAVFHGGADFRDPPPLGENGRSRYVKIRTVEEADTPDVRDWIRQAGTVEGWS